ncbi:hypothetical protein Pmar_PMAR026042 [Perkinsus marinus ATCC 50983]|uniref:Uncharacterized protein n=2 Tax=Perkinsus marinus (strain ATCC 50983 / TXsc) TaxID=423536 RepID=C5LK96_PERM5|nr:hypothetical protein Pmar_PMAR026042 [Perkinsus marinus ATCC 50983]EER02883.1 hypothetical protein Pmar_PMAR026042 [Perkinsus marinus ATCC 50983]|eukprot:XP_002771067.1 hypothetical protein Pmar_PMAR026042 [Perkinsus marinus ATCC 50983]
MSNAIITSSVAASKIDALSKYVDLYSDLPSLQEVIDYHHVKSQAEHVQVCYGNVDTVRSLLELSASVIGGHPEGWTALHMATHMNSAEMAHMLLEAVPREELSMADPVAPSGPHGLTPLMTACQNIRTEEAEGIVEELLGIESVAAGINTPCEASGSIYRGSEWPLSACSITNDAPARYTALHLAADSHSSLPIVRCLLAHGASPLIRARNTAKGFASGAMLSVTAREAVKKAWPHHKRIANSTLHEYFSFDFGLVRPEELYTKMLSFTLALLASVGLAGAVLSAPRDRLDHDHCTATAVDCAATADGGCIAATSADGSPLDFRMVYVPPKTYGPGEKRAVYKQFQNYPRIVDASRAPSYAPTSPDQKPSVPIGYIDMPEGTTYGYWDAAYGVMNEAGLSMGESSCSGRLSSVPKGDGPNGSGALFWVGELSDIALESTYEIEDELLLPPDDNLVRDEDAMDKPTFAVSDDPIIHTVYQNEWYRITTHETGTGDHYFAADICIQLYAYMQIHTLKSLSSKLLVWFKGDLLSFTRLIYDILRLHEELRLLKADKATDEALVGYGPSTEWLHAAGFQDFQATPAQFTELRRRYEKTQKEADEIRDSALNA